MKKHIYFLLLFTFSLQIYSASAQQAVPDYMIRVYEDNDCLNLLGEKTDDSYSNGTRLDIFYTKTHSSKLFIDRLMPKAGTNSTNVYGLSIMQIIYTPKDLASSSFQYNDYPYSGSLFATHSLNSYNAEKKYDVQTELLAGVLGPDAFSGQTQTLVHRVMDFQHPMGWNNQFKNDLLLNLSFAAEKEFWNYHQIVEVIGGGHLYGGTMADGADGFATIRIGKMMPYFNGLISQYTSAHQKGISKRIQAYLFIKPGVEYVMRNSLLQGGMSSGLPVIATGDGNKLAKEQIPSIDNTVAYIAYGMAVSFAHVGFSYSETTSSATLTGLYGHSVGNISVYYHL